MGLFDRIGQALGNIRPEQFLAAQAIANGDYAGAARIRASMAADERERAEQEAVAEQRNRQIASGKNLGYSGDELAVLSGTDLSANYRSRIDPFNLSPGERRYVPGAEGGRAESMTEAPNPTADQRTYEWLRSLPGGEDLARSYAAKQALIINSGIDPSTGAPYSQAIDPRQLFSFGDDVPTPSPTAPRINPPSQSGAPALPSPSARRRPAAAYGDPVRELTELAGMAPSSGFRTQGHQDALVAQGRTPARRSQHTSGNALDFPIARGPRQQEVAERIRQRYPQARFEFEGTNLHVTLPGWGGAPDLSNSRGRYPDASAPRRAEGQNVPRITSPQELARLRPGQVYRAPDGSLRRKS